jgi:hypothetical protein
MDIETIKKPSAAETYWERWKRFGKWIGDYQARALLSVFYFIVLAPFALVVRRWSDPLAVKPGSANGWRGRSLPEGSPMKKATQQF